MIDFINDDHKEMHEVLIQNGFAFKQDVVPFKGAIKYPFVYKNKKLNLIIICGYNTGDYVGVLYLSSEECHKHLFGKSFKDVTKYFNVEDNPVTIERITSKKSLGGTPYYADDDIWVNIKVPAPEVYPNLWDTYAAAALNGLLSCGSLQSMDAASDLAKYAAELADSLIIERNKRYG